jgi:hypothetical protein
MAVAEQPASKKNNSRKSSEDHARLMTAHNQKALK